MAELTSADVTLTKIKKQRVGLMRESLYKVAFGDGAKTVPTNGVPLPVLGQFGLKRVDFHQLAPVTINGYHYLYDEVNHSIRIFESAAHAHNLMFKANAAANAVTMAANSLRNASAGDLTVAGGGADGGIMLVAAGPLTEVPTSHAPAATTLRLLLRGK